MLANVERVQSGEVQRFGTSTTTAVGGHAANSLPNGHGGHAQILLLILQHVVQYEYTENIRAAYWRCIYCYSVVQVTGSILILAVYLYWRHAYTG